MADSIYNLFDLERAIIELAREGHGMPWEIREKVAPVFQMLGGVENLVGPKGGLKGLTLGFFEASKAFNG